MRKKILTPNILKILIYTLFGVLLLYFIFAIFPDIFLRNNIETEVAEQTTYRDSIDLYGIALRNEVVVFADESVGCVTYSVENGGRVSINSTVASYVTDTSSADSYAKLSALNNEISIIESSLAQSAISDTDALESDVRDKIRNYLDSLKYGCLEKSNADAVQISINKKDVKLNGSEAYTEELERLEQQKDTVLALIGDEKTVKASIAGYFISDYDGYESFTADEYNKMTVEDFNDIMNMPVSVRPDNYIGKLQNNTVWYFAADISEETAQAYKTGESVNLVFGTSLMSAKSFTASIYNISAPSDGKCIITFKLTDFTEFEFSLRKEKCKMVLNTYEGIKVSNEALRMSEGQTGVYVLVAKKVVFKPVTVLFSTDTFSIVKPDNTVLSRVLTQNDEVVVGGKDLFDGKVVGIG